MRRLAFVLIAAVLGAGLSGPRAGPRAATRPASLTLVGTWEGAVTVRGARETLTVTFASDTGAKAGVVTIPGRYALAYPLHNVRLQGIAAHFEYPPELEAGRFDVTLELGRMTGVFSGEQNGDSLAGTVELWRVPSAHAPYRSVEVRFRGGEGALAATLLEPTGPGPHHAVVFLHGSGPQTRDSYIRYFADRFARAGVAVLIYDKRGTGASEGTNWMRSSASFADLAADGLAGVAFLAKRPEIDSTRIGLWGLSQGAWLGPLAATRGRDVAFVVMLSGGGVSPSEQELYDDEVKLHALGYTEAEIAEAMALLRLGDAFIRDGQDSTWARLQASLSAARQQRWFRYLDKFPLVLPREAWWHGSDLDYDPRPTLGDVRVPVLAILGENDMSTPSRPTAERIEGALRKAGNPDYTVNVVLNANHALQVGPDPWARIRRAGGGGSPAESTAAPAWDWMRPAPGWIDTMVAWVVRRTKGARR